MVVGSLLEVMNNPPYKNKFDNVCWSVRLFVGFQWVSKWHILLENVYEYIVFSYLLIYIENWSGWPFEEPPSPLKEG
jgi:hypothetical protein